MITTTTTITERRTVAGPGTKSKRVRTGCLTCRERHLKCDEAAPNCLNCRKSNRICKRGVRLNFLEVNVHKPQRIPFAKDWAVEFQDESRQIASEYRGGLGRYPAINLRTSGGQRSTPNSVRQHLACTVKSRHIDYRLGNGHSLERNDIKERRQQQLRRCDRHQSLFSNYGEEFANGVITTNGPAPASCTPNEGLFGTGTIALNSFPASFEPTLADELVAVKQEALSRTRASSEKSTAASIRPQATVAHPNASNDPSKDRPVEEGCSPLSHDGSSNGEREYLGSPEEVRFMQVFVDDVAVWMDSFDPLNHFSQITPYHALRSPMLLNACLACGVKRHSFASPSLNDKALSYYNTATTQLLRSLQNPDRNMTECATAAVVLNVYETMTDTDTQRMYHVAGARALIRECGWNATSKGIGAACFWLNIEMEVMNCLAMNWHTTWNPDEWGVDMDSLGPKAEGGTGSGEEEDTGSIGHEECWVHRIFYIMAKVADFRASTAQFPEWSPHHESAKQGARLAEWEKLKNLCTRWNNACPRTMHPIGYLDPDEGNASESSFPKIWLIKRAAVISRLFYHAARCILAQTAPQESPRSASGWYESQVHHARQVCGIVTYAKDVGIASVAIRCIAIVGPLLSEKREQDEIRQTLGDIASRSGIEAGSVEKGLEEAWSWGKPPCQGSIAQQDHADQTYGDGQSPQSKGNDEFEAPRSLVGMEMNPLSYADFNLPNHPYQNWYEPPNRTSAFSPAFF